MTTLILAGGDAPTRTTLDTHWVGWDEAIDLVIAADGGARHAADLALVIDRWVGDGDSIDPALLERLAAAGVVIDRAPVDKDRSDTELAIRSALAAGATSIAILGATGGPRIDHELANLGLLAMPELDAIPTVMYTPGSRLRQLDGPTPWVSVSGRPGDVVSLLPVSAVVSGIETRDLRFPLAGETLRIGASRGLSNVVGGDAPAVRWRVGRLLIVETPVTIDR